VTACTAAGIDSCRKPVVFVKTSTLGTASGDEPASGASTPSATASRSARLIPPSCLRGRGAGTAPLHPLDETGSGEPEVKRGRLREGRPRHVWEAAPEAAVGQPPRGDCDLHLR